MTKSNWITIHKLFLGHIIDTTELQLGLDNMVDSMVDNIALDSMVDSFDNKVVAKHIN